MPEFPPQSWLQRRWPWLALLVVTASLCGAALVRSNRRPPGEEEFKTERYIIPQPAVTELVVKQAAQAELAPDELVLGATLGGESRAYPLNMLNAEPRTKVLNDVLGGRDIAVTWCDRCRAGIVFDRRVGDMTLTLAVFGSLWRESMVLYDQETMTQWSQWDGQGRMGPLLGRRLECLPSNIAAWQDWLRQYPDSTVVILERRQAEFAGETYRPADQYVLSVGTGAAAKAWTLSELAKRRVVNDGWQDKSVVAFYLAASGTARLFERQLDGRTLTFCCAADAFHDVETGSVWSPLSGQALAGPLLGRRLTALPATVSSQAAWQRFQVR